MTVAREDAPAVENPAFGYRKGEQYGPVTQLRIDKASGDLSYCAHGDFCYRAGAFDFTSPFSFETKPLDDFDDDEMWMYNAK